MKPSLLQKIVMTGAWIIYGLLAFGSFLDAIANAITLIGLQIAIIGTVLATLIWIVLEAVLRKKGILWIRSGEQVLYKSLGLKAHIMFLGGVLLLWIPIGIDAIRDDPLLNYVAIENVDAWYYSNKSLREALPDPSVRIDSRNFSIVPTDDESQIAFMRLYQLVGYPIFELTIRNSHPSKFAEISEIRVNLNRGKDWWGINTSFIAPSREMIICGPMSTIKVKGTPYMDNSNQRVAFSKLLYGQKPYDMVGAAKVCLKFGGEVLTHRPFSLNKLNIKQYNSDDF